MALVPGQTEKRPPRPSPLATHGERVNRALIAFSQEGEEDLDLLGCLLDVAEVIEDEQLEAVNRAPSLSLTGAELQSRHLLGEVDGQR